MDKEKVKLMRMKKDEIVNELMKTQKLNEENLYYLIALDAEFEELEDENEYLEKQLENFKKYVSCKRCLELIEKLNQDKLEFAIAELKKVREFLFDMQAPCSVLDGVDQQIESLKEKL